MLVRLLLALISVTLYLLAENRVDHTLIYFASIIYIINAIILVWKDLKKREYISFNILFSISFFLCSYAYVLFVMDSQFWDLGTWATHMVNFDYVTRGVTLSTLSYSMYCLGYSFYNRKKIQQNKEFESEYSIKKIKPFFIISAVALSLNVAYSVFTLNTINITSSPFISVFFRIALCMSLVNNSKNLPKNSNISVFYKRNKLELIVCFVLSGMYLYVGDRGFPIFVTIVMLYTFSHYYKKLNIAIFVSIMAITACFMFAVRVTRTGDNSIKNAGLASMFDSSKEVIGESPAILMFSDLLGANSEMCTGLEYVESFGFHKPEQVILIPLTPFPILPSLGAFLMYGKSNYTSLLASSVFNEFTFNNYGSKAHWGNHVTVDIYYRWGLIGIFFFFYIFGYMVSKIERKQSTSLFYETSFLILIGLSVYLSRDSIISYVRPLAWTYIIIWIYRKKLNVKV